MGVVGGLVAAGVVDFAVAFDVVVDEDRGVVAVVEEHDAVVAGVPASTVRRMPLSSM